MDETNEVKLPKIIQFAYVNYKVEKTKRIATCKYSTRERSVITNGVGTTSNFVRRVERVHVDR
jgi:hypothetical protein